MAGIKSGISQISSDLLYDKLDYTASSSTESKANVINCKPSQRQERGIS